MLKKIMIMFCFFAYLPACQNATELSEEKCEEEECLSFEYDKYYSGEYNKFLSGSFWNKATLSEVNEIIERGKFDINQKDYGGHTALSFALDNQNIDIEIIKALIDNGADVDNWIDFQFITNLDILKLLIKHSKTFNFNQTNKYGNNFLIEAAGYNSNPDVIIFLVENGLDVNSKGFQGTTPLIEAAELNKNFDIIKTLLSLGADLGIENIYGETAFDYAQSNPYIKDDFNKLKP